MSSVPSDDLVLVAPDEVGRQHFAFTQRYLAAIEAGATGDALAAFFTEDLVQHEFPNRLVPHGVLRDRAAILDGALRGQSVMSAQKFDIHKAIAVGTHVALELTWTGTVAIPLASLRAGDQMRAHFAVFLEFRDGRIARQNNYDCFDPF